MRLSLSLLTLASAGTSSAAAQWHMPAINLADMPVFIDDGDTYTISGTVTSIPNGSVIVIQIANVWNNDDIEFGTDGDKYETTVIGGAFTAPSSFTFNGAGSYQVRASYNNGAVKDFQMGGVYAPDP